MLSNKFLLFCIVSIFSFNLINCMYKPLPISQPLPLCKSKSCCNLESNKRCYCSRKCGPREKEAGDNPVWVDGICFCKQWDADNYYTNGCDAKDIDEE